MNHIFASYTYTKCKKIHIDFTVKYYSYEVCWNNSMENKHIARVNIGNFIVDDWVIL